MIKKLGNGYSLVKLVVSIHMWSDLLNV